MPLEVVGSDGSGQRSRGPKRSRVSDEKAGPSGAKPRKKPQEFDAPAVASPCSVCGRRFGSWKALFGHMRSHPERDWRGIHPPPKFNREGTPEGPDDVYQEDAENVMIRQQADNLLLGVAQDVAARLGTAATAETAGFTSPIVTTVSEGSKTESNINHRCNICLQVFSSGQDLGEHVLSHYSDRQFQAASSSSTPQRRRGLSIDLNFPNEPDAELTSSPPPPSERKEGGFDLNRQPSPGDEEK